jgi:hypothetical protein
MDEERDSFKKTARLVGLFWLLGAATAGFGLIYVRPLLLVKADAAATANNLLAHESLFRSAIVSTLFSQVFLLFFGVMAFRLFRRVDKTWARIFLTSVLMSAAIAVVNTLNNVAALIMLSKTDDLRAFGQQELNALMMIFLRLSGFGVGLAELFLGVCLLALGLLVVRSRLVPKILGVLLIFASCGFALNTSTKILIPQFHSATFTGLAMFGGSLVMPTILWLLIKGVRETTDERVPFAERAEVL